jgi:putative ABC transport system substrate-binding protein
MQRVRAGLALLLGLVVTDIAPVAAEATQAGKVYRLGYLSQPTRASVERGVESFVRALRELGWVEGKNLIIEYRWADGDAERLPALAAELVRDNVDVIVAPAGTAALAAKNATTKIPIVMMFPSDPVGSGLVASLARPGANVTGTTFTAGPEIFGKQLQILKESVPKLSRLAVLRNPADPGWSIQGKEVEAAARSLGIRIHYADARGDKELDGAFATMARERADALLVSGSSTFLAHRSRVAELALKGRLPTMENFREMVEAGGLMAYAVNMPDFVGRAAVYVDKILKGAKPADLPVEQPTKFQLVVNLKTAAALGLAIPASVLQRADGLIE